MVSPCRGIHWKSVHPARCTWFLRLLLHVALAEEQSRAQWRLQKRLKILYWGQKLQENDTPLTPFLDELWELIMTFRRNPLVLIFIRVRLKFLSFTFTSQCYLPCKHHVSSAIHKSRCKVDFRYLFQCYSRNTKKQGKHLLIIFIQLIKAFSYFYNKFNYVCDIKKCKKKKKPRENVIYISQN